MSNTLLCVWGRLPGGKLASCKKTYPGAVRQPTCPDCGKPWTLSDNNDENAIRAMLFDFIDSQFTETLSDGRPIWNVTALRDRAWRFFQDRIGAGKFIHVPKGDRYVKLSDVEHWMASAFKSGYVHAKIGPSDDTSEWEKKCGDLEDEADEAAKEDANEWMVVMQDAVDEDWFSKEES